ncbi:FAD-dependent monooxygenase [Streptomyces sp. NPDC048825]|uniref:FAD-dependent monooxygenase n=1 Tax=Streptomyces sp. NPDC048825 TaxID=3365592 RepID=UPI0037174D13
MITSPASPLGAHDRAMRILVAGGGISGLATAVALGKRGHHVLVLEQRPVFTESGAGVRLAPEGFQLLDRLGVGEAVRARSLTINEFRIMDGSTGKPVTSESLLAGCGWSCSAHATAHRLDVYEPLLEACWDLDSVQLCADSRVVGYTQHGESVVAALADGRSVTGDALILTDGARSLVHNDAQQACGASQEQLAVYSAVIPMELVASRWQGRAATSWVGVGWHVSHYPLPDYRYLSLSATRHRHTGDSLSGARVDLEQVLAAFPDIGYAARNALTMGEHWRAWTVLSRKSTSGRVRGRVALVGDIAQPARPLEVSGMHHALKDAVELGKSWDVSGGGARSWLAEYDARRGEQACDIRAGCGSRYGQTRWADDQALARPFLSTGTASDRFDGTPWGTSHFCGRGAGWAGHSAAEADPGHVRGRLITGTITSHPHNTPPPPS